MRPTIKRTIYREGNRYNFHERHSSKTKAEKVAERLRGKGLSARIVHTKGYYAIYFR